MAAVSAARFIPGKNISILERGPRVGKKLLVTGNGRCNLTNLELDFSRYHARRKALFPLFSLSFRPKTHSPCSAVSACCAGRKARALLSLRRPGLAVLDVLRRYLEGRNVEERCQTSVETVKRKPGGYELKTSGGVVSPKD